MGAPDSLFEAAGRLKQMRDGLFVRRSNEKGGGGGGGWGGSALFNDSALDLSSSLKCTNGMMGNEAVMDGCLALVAFRGYFFPSLWSRW